MANDLLIKNGLIIDGTGGEPYHGDVAVRGGRIVETGAADGSAARVIDADGQAVAPGFWDVHTHYDAQFLWDPIATSSSWHGVTSVIMGNCGITLAPCKPEDQDYLIRMLAHVEAMDERVVSTTLPWEWGDYADFLRALEPRLGLNAATFVGHSTLRRNVMGPECAERAATDDEVARMKQLLRESVAAGALGLSTARVATHWDGDGNPVPSRVAELSEIYELAATLGEMDRGIVQLAVGSDFNKYTDEGRERLAKLMRVSGRPVCINSVAQTTTNVDGWKLVLDWMARMRDEGGRIIGLGNVVPNRREFNLRYTDFFDRFPLWLKLSMQPFEEKMRMLVDPAHRARLRDDTENVTDTFFLQNPIKWDLVTLVKAKTERWKRFEGMSLQEIGEALGLHPTEALFDISVSEDLDTQFRQTGNRNPDEAAQMEILRAPDMIPEQSDAGAHVITENNTGFPSHLLGHWVREREALSIQEAVQRMTSVPAGQFGVTDRGALRPGMAADIVIFDPETITAGDPEFADDLPNGGRRLIQRGEGVAYTVVNGEVTLDHGEYTGARAGQTLRRG